MSPIEWAIRPLQRYAQFSGRAPRAEYWWFVLAVTITGFVLGLVDFALFHGPVYGNLGPLGLTFTVAMVVPALAVLVRRLHDTDRSGWWALVRLPYYSLILAGSSFSAIGTAFQRSTSAVLGTAIIAVVACWALGSLAVFFFVIAEGDGGPNRYGADPYGGDELEEVFA